MDGKLLATGLPSYDLELLQRAFDALHRTTGLEGRLVDISVPGQHGRRADALVEITAEGKRHTYVAVLKRVDRFATLGIIKHQFEQYDKPGLLVTSYVTPEVAERCRTLVAAGTRGALSTLAVDPDGYPYGSVASYGLDDRGNPLFFVSLMAEHTQNALRDPRASLLVTEPVPEGADPLASGRVTLMGQMTPVPGGP